MFSKIKQFFKNLTEEKITVSLGKEMKVSSHAIDIHGFSETTIRKIGKFEDGTKPGSGAEHLCKSDFTRQRVQKGKYGGNLLDYDDVFYMCPKCSVIHSIKFKHGDVWKCSCGLIAQSHGNGLDIWE